MLAADNRARIPGEEALWRYKRGAARVARGRLDAACRGSSAPRPAPSRATWVQGRARVELARDRAGDAATGAPPRDEARRRETLCEQGNDPVCVEEAQDAAEGCRWPVRSRRGSGSSLGIVVVGILGVVAMAGAGFYFFSQHIETHEASRRGRRTEFERDQGSASRAEAAHRARQPRQLRSSRIPTERPTPNGRAREQLNVLAFDPDEARIVTRHDPVLAPAAEDARRQRSTSTATGWTSRTSSLPSRTSSASARRSSSTTRSADGERVLVWSQ